MALRIDVNVEPALLLQRMEHGVKRLAFSVAAAINSTALAVQAAEVAHARHALTIRKEDFILGKPGRGGQIAIISPFANVYQNRPYAEIAVGAKTGLLLSEYEAGGARVPFKGSGAVAVPVIGGPARPSFAEAVPTAFKFASLRLRLTPRKPGAKRARHAPGVAIGPNQQPVRYGLEDTYQVPGVGVFQHVVGGGSRLVYAFVHGERIEPKLDFVGIAERVADRVFARELESEIDDVLIRHGLTRSDLA